MSINKRTNELNYLQENETLKKDNCKCLRFEEELFNKKEKKRANIMKLISN